MRVLLRLMLVLVLALSLGLHWALLQTVAWTGMLVSYAQQDDLATAVSKTFDGEHPCPLCTAVEQGRAAERQQEKQTAKSGFKLEPGLLDPVALLVADQPRGWVAGENLFFPSRSDDPPRPRPRRAIASPV